MIRNDRRRTTRYHDLRLSADRRFAYGCLAFVGVRTTWIPGWIIDSGNYAGQRAVMPFAEIRSGMGGRLSGGCPSAIWLILSCTSIRTIRQNFGKQCGSGLGHKFKNLRQSRRSNGVGYFSRSAFLLCRCK